MSKHIKYQKPNFDQRWSAAESFPEFQDMGKIKWKNFAGAGYQVHLHEIEEKIENLEYLENNPVKKIKVQENIANGMIEMPIIVKISEDKYEVLCGKTRISELIKQKQDPLVWVVDISEMMFLIRPMN